MFLRNVNSNKNHAASHPRRLHSSVSFSVECDLSSHWHWNEAAVLLLSVCVGTSGKSSILRARALGDVIFHGLNS
jgi:hypothetical protein